MENKCYICNSELVELEELDRLTHINNCLDREIDKAIETVDPSSVTTSKAQVVIEEEEKEFDLNGMPDYDSMSSADLKKALDEFGMKKTLEIKFAKVLLKQTWIYERYGVFPKCLAKYV